MRPRQNHSLKHDLWRQERIRSARRAMRMHLWSQASETLKSVLEKRKRDAEAMLLMGLACEGQRRMVEARKWARRSMKSREHPEAIMLLARLCRVEGESDEAIDLCNRLLRTRPEDMRVLILKTGILEEAGRFDEARKIAETLINKLQGTDGLVALQLRFEWAKLLLHDKRFGEATTCTDEMLEQSRLTADMHRAILHLKAKACDRNKDYDAAFEAAQTANEIGRLEFDAELYEDQVQMLMEVWSADDLPRFPLSTCDSELPIFIAGMPRSGTSLIDQVIDAHPLAAGVGELSSIELLARQLSSVYDSKKPVPECFGEYTSRRLTRCAEEYIRELKKLTGRHTRRVVNKALGNNKLVGLLARLFPKTRIIHAVRDPRDVAVSCFMGGFNNAVHAWTTQLDWVACAWEQSQRMMDHWKQVVDVEILDVHYEAMVADPERQFKRIVEFIGLEWDDACLSFHKTQRTVRTLSYDQVNRPVYTSSSGRHANYAAQLDGVDFPEYQMPIS